MNIAFFEIHDWETEQLEKRFSKHNLKFFSEPLSEKNVHEVKDANIISVFIYSKVSKEILSKLPELKLLTTRSMGFDHIDLKAARKRGVDVCTSPHYGDNSVAEHAFGLILSVSRNIHKAFIRTVVEDYTTEGLQGIDLKGKTLGVIGTGRIGSHLIQMAKGFEMKVIASDVFKNKKLERELKFKYVPLSQLLKTADVISVHVPYVAKNHHLLNSSNLKYVKKGAILVNTSRGPIVDTKAMIEALNSGRLSGIALDVIEGEELIKEEKEILHRLNQFDIKKMRQLLIDHQLLHDERVVFTPHIAFYTKEAVQRILDVTMDNVQAGIKGKAINVIN
jgi:D-lactate dehydrogenase